MPDNKLTDKEIVKALEGMIQFANTVGRSVLDMVDVKTLKNILDLINRLQTKNKELDEKLVIYKGTIDWQVKEINRLQAENERLKDILIKLRELHDRAKGIIVTQNGEIERLKDELLESNIEIAELYKCKFSADDVAQNIIRAKAEARKEFAERIKAEYSDFDEKHEVILPENINKTIDDVLKETEDAL